jgi:hypothetical protein
LRRKKMFLLFLDFKPIQWCSKSNLMLLRVMVSVRHYCSTVLKTIYGLCICCCFSLEFSFGTYLSVIISVDYSLSRCCLIIFHNFDNDLINSLFPVFEFRYYLLLIVLLARLAVVHDGSTY